MCSVELCVECAVCKVQFSTELLASHMMHLCSSAAMMSYVDNELGGKTVQCNAEVYGAVYYYVVQCSTVQCSAVLCSAVLQCIAVQCSAVHCSTVQCRG